MGFSYRGANVLLFCTERPMILAYCRGELSEDLTAWAQHHIAHCPGCLQSAMRTLDDVEKQSAVPASAPPKRVVDVESTPVKPARPRPAPSYPMLWAVAGFLVLGLGSVGLGALVARVLRDLH